MRAFKLVVNYTSQFLKDMEVPAGLQQQPVTAHRLSSRYQVGMVFGTLALNPYADLLTKQNMGGFVVFLS